MVQLLTIAMLALAAVCGTSAAGLVESGPPCMIQAAKACYATMMQNAESMATVIATGTPFADESCFVDCVKEILGPMAGMVEREVQNAARFVPPPMHQCAEILLGTTEGASKNECQRIVDGAQCAIGQAMAMFA